MPPEFYEAMEEIAQLRLDVFSVRDLKSPDPVAQNQADQIDVLQRVLAESQRRNESLSRKVGCFRDALILIAKGVEDEVIKSLDQVEELSS